MVDREGVSALEADGDAFAALVGGNLAGVVLLEHVGCAFEFEPAPADLAVDDPLFGALVAEAVDVEAERGFHVGDHEEGNGLLDVGFGRHG